MALHLGQSSFVVGGNEPVEFSYEYDTGIYLKLLTPAAVVGLTGGEDLTRFVRRLGLGAARKDYSLPLEAPAAKARVEDRAGHARLFLRWGKQSGQTAVFELGDLGSAARLTGRTFGMIGLIILTGPDATFHGGQVTYIDLDLGAAPTSAVGQPSVTSSKVAQRVDAAPRRKASADEDSQRQAQQQ